VVITSCLAYLDLSPQSCVRGGEPPAYKAFTFRYKRKKILLCVSRKHSQSFWEYNQRVNVAAQYFRVEPWADMLFILNTLFIDLLNPSMKETGRTAWSKSLSKLTLFSAKILTIVTYWKQKWRGMNLEMKSHWQAFPISIFTKVSQKRMN